MSKSKISIVRKTTSVMLAATSAAASVSVLPQGIVAEEHSKNEFSSKSEIDKQFLEIKKVSYSKDRKMITISCNGRLTENNHEFYEAIYNNIKKIVVNEHSYKEGFRVNLQPEKREIFIEDINLKDNKIESLILYTKDNKTISWKKSDAGNDGSVDSHEENGNTEIIDKPEVNILHKIDIIKGIGLKKGEFGYFYLDLKPEYDNQKEKFKNDIKSIVVNKKTVPLYEFRELTRMYSYSIDRKKWDSFGINTTEDENNRVTITFKNGDKIEWPKGDLRDNSSESTVESSVSENDPLYTFEAIDDFNINNSEDFYINLKTRYGENEEKHIRGINLDERKDEFVANIESISINNTEFSTSSLSTSHRTRTITLTEEAKEKLKFNFKESDNILKITFKNKKSIVLPKGSSSSNTTDSGKKEELSPKPSVPSDKEKIYNLKDKLPKGEYTIGFEAKYADGRDGYSMLQGFFDERVKLVVKEDGSMEIEMLCLLFADGLYDLAMQNDGKWSSTIEKKNYGNPDVNNKYRQAIFKLPVKNLDQVHLAGVIVGYMGAVETDKGQFDKYTRVNINFKEGIKKGFTNYKQVEEDEKARILGEKVLNSRLIANGFDSNQGKVTKENIKNFKGDTVNLSSDYDKDKETEGKDIYDISILKDLGPSVKRLVLTGNAISELPKGIFDGMTNLEEIDLAANRLDTLDKNLFAKNKKLKKIRLSSNKLGTIDKDFFINNPEIEEIDLSNAWLKDIPGGLFKNNSKLKILQLESNNLFEMADDAFSHNEDLNFLNISDNNLSKMPSSVSELTGLSKIYMQNNKIKELPDLSKLKNLFELNASYNELDNIDDRVWENIMTNRKNNVKVNLIHNNLKRVPVEILNKGRNVISVDLAYNYLPEKYEEIFNGTDSEKTGVNPRNHSSYNPQKTAVNLNVRIDAKNIIVDSTKNLTMLDLANWRYPRGGAIGTVKPDKKSYLEELKEYKSVEEMVKAKSDSYSWKINTKVERIRNGHKSLVDEKITTEKEDEKFIFNDLQMREGDKYIVTKTLLFRRDASNGYVKEVSVTTTLDAPKDDKKDVKRYAVPVKLMHAYEEKPSMGNAALLPNAIVEEKDGLRTVYISFKGMNALNLYGHLTKVFVYPGSNKNGVPKESSVEKMFKDKGLDGKEKDFIKTVSFVREGNRENVIWFKVYVDAMDALTPSKTEGSGAQDAKLIFDWSKAKETDKTWPEDVLDKENKKIDEILNNATRLQGRDRYGTAISISKKFFKNANNVVLASGENNADALVSASYAKLKEAPILLTKKDEMPVDVIKEIERLNTKNITIIGGNTSISSEVESVLKGKGYNVNRISGKDRYETSTILAKDVMKMGNSKKIAVINGKTSADALTISSLATKYNLPVVMIKNIGANDTSIKEINTWGISEAIIAGGDSSVSEDTLHSIKAYIKRRIAGKNRYETALKIAKESYPNSKNIFIGNGEISVDSLSAGAVTSRVEAPILLIKKDKIDDNIKKAIEEMGTGEAYILGGKSTIALGK